MQRLGLVQRFIAALSNLTQPCSKDRCSDNYTMSFRNFILKRAYKLHYRCMFTLTSQCSTLVRNTVVRAILQAYGKW